MEILFAVLIFALAAAGMAVGVMFGCRPLTGSCGGIDCIPGAGCEDCPVRAEAERTPR